MTTGRINQVAFLFDAGTAQDLATPRWGVEDQGQAQQSCVSSENTRFGQTETRSPHTHNTFRIQEHENAHMVHDKQATKRGLHGSTWTSSRSCQHPKGRWQGKGSTRNEFRQGRYATQEPLNHPRCQPRLDQQLCVARPTVRCTSTEPAKPYNPTTTHMP